MYRYWTNPDNEALLRKAVKQARSFREVLRILGLVQAGGNYHNIRHHISRLDLDISHFLGQGWNKGNYKNRDYANNTYWKKYLIREYGHKCGECRRKTWNKKPIPLEVEHLDGNRYNFDKENLILLCCNCHAQTETWRRRKSAGVV